MPSVHEMIRQELHAAKHFILAGQNEFAVEEINHAIMLLSIVHKRERGPMSEAEGMAWYQKMAEECPDEFARKIYARIAADEVAHVKFVEEHGFSRLENQKRN